MSATAASRRRAPVPPAVLFAIDDDPGTVHALRDDLSRRFSQEFGIVCESSADAGLAALRELADQHEQVALLIVGHDMSRDDRRRLPWRARMICIRSPSGCSWWSATTRLAARSSQAMTLGEADYHITKPWMREQDLYRDGQ